MTSPSRRWLEAPRGPRASTSGRGAIEEARALARERSVADRSTFLMGDAAKVHLDRHHVVLLNRVLCCYPDIDALLDNSLSAASHVYAFTAPSSAGFAGTFSRAQTRLANSWFLEGLR